MAKPVRRAPLVVTPYSHTLELPDGSQYWATWMHDPNDGRDFLRLTQRGRSAVIDIPAVAADSFVIMLQKSAAVQP